MELWLLIMACINKHKCSISLSKTNQKRPPVSMVCMYKSINNSLESFLIVNESGVLLNHGFESGLGLLISGCCSTFSHRGALLARGRRSKHTLRRGD